MKDQVIWRKIIRKAAWGVGGDGTEPLARTSKMKIRRLICPSVSGRQELECGFLPGVDSIARGSSWPSFSSWSLFPWERTVARALPRVHCRGAWRPHRRKASPPRPCSIGSQPERMTTFLESGPNLMLKCETQDTWSAQRSSPACGNGGHLLPVLGTPLPKSSNGFPKTVLKETETMRINLNMLSSSVSEILILYDANLLAFIERRPSTAEIKGRGRGPARTFRITLYRWETIL